MATVCKVSAFQYERLAGTDIRLLSIDQGDSDEVNCQLNHIPLDENPHFYALSYVWGDISNKRSIFVNGYSFAITQNVYTALRKLRSIPRKDQHTTALFWIDAICIDQAEAKEKDEQIPRIRDIYSKAATVFVWLSPLEGKTNPHVAFGISYVESEFCKGSTLDGFQTYLEAYNDVSVTDEDQEILGGVWSSAFYGFQSHPWFSRVWTLQEAVFAKEAPVFLFEQDTDKWISFDTFLNVIKHLPSLSTEALSKLVELRRWVLESRLSVNASMETRVSVVLQKLLYYTSGRKATVPHDRLYGIYGMLRIIQEQYPQFCLPEVKYERPAAHVFTEFAKLIIQHTGNTCILDHAGIYLRLPGAPTWVSILSTWKRHFREPIKKLEDRPQVSDDGNVLRIKAALVDRCVYVIPQMERPCDPVEALPQLDMRIQEIEEEAINPLAVRRNLNPYTIWEALLQKESLTWAHERHVIRRLTCYESDIEPADLFGDMELDGALRQAIFITEAGYLGFSNENCLCTVGDYVCCRIDGDPIFLRQRCGTEQYEVVGIIDSCEEALRNRHKQDFRFIELI